MAQIVLPHTFETGQPAFASEVNANFAMIVNALNTGLGNDNLAANSVGSAQLRDESVTGAKVKDGVLADQHFHPEAGLSHSKMAALDPLRAAATDEQGKLISSSVTLAELERLSTVRSNIQNQLDFIRIPNVDTGTFVLGSTPFDNYRDLARGRWLVRAVAGTPALPGNVYPLRVLVRVSPSVTINVAPEVGSPSQGVYIYSSSDIFSVPGSVQLTRAVGASGSLTVDFLRWAL